MKLTKITHCTLLFEYENKKILVDPGKNSIENYRDIIDIDYLFITDGHEDHYDMSGITPLLSNNPGMNIVMTQPVNEKFITDYPEYQKEIKIVTDDQEINIGGVIWSVGVEDHINAYPKVVKPKKILWYQVEDKYFGSGDTFKLPKGKVKYMGVNVIAPFGSMERFIEHALQAKPENVFNSHDGYLNKDFTVGFYELVKTVLEENGIKYEFLNDGDSVEI